MKLLLLGTMLTLGTLVGPSRLLAATPAEEARTRQTLAPVRDSTHTFRVYPRNDRDLRTEAIVMQERDFSCGAAALATVLRYQWQAQVNETQLLVALVLILNKDEMQDRIKNGLSLTDLKRLAAKFGYQAVLGRLTVEKLRDSKVPLIVGVTVDKFEHFVVYRGMDEQYVYLADPARGRVRVPISQFEKQWQKNAVLVVIKPDADLTKPAPLMATEYEKSLGVVTQQTLRSQLTSPAMRF